MSINTNSGTGCGHEPGAACQPAGRWSDESPAPHSFPAVTLSAGASAGALAIPPAEAPAAFIRMEA